MTKKYKLLHIKKKPSGAGQAKQYEIWCDIPDKVLRELEGVVDLKITRYNTSYTFGIDPRYPTEDVFAEIELWAVIYESQTIDTDDGDPTFVYAPDGKVWLVVEINDAVLKQGKDDG